MEKGFILSLIFAAIIAIFALNNSDRVLIDLIFTEIQLSQAIIILISALFGAVIAAAFSWVRSLKSNKKIKNLNNEITELNQRNKELNELVESKDKQIKRLSKEIVDSPKKAMHSEEYIQMTPIDEEDNSPPYPDSELKDKN